MPHIKRFTGKFPLKKLIDLAPGVFLAQRNGQQVVVKSYSRDNLEQVERIQLAAEHKVGPEVLDVYANMNPRRGKIWVVMEYYNGGDARKGYIPQRLRTKLYLQLSELHDLGFAHTDIKQANIFRKLDANGVVIGVTLADGEMEDVTPDLIQIDEQELERALSMTHSIPTGREIRSTQSESTASSEESSTEENEAISMDYTDSEGELQTFRTTQTSWMATSSSWL